MGLVALIVTGDLSYVHFFCKMGQRQIYDVCRYPNIYYRTINGTAEEETQSFLGSPVLLGVSYFTSSYPASVMTLANSSVVMSFVAVTSAVLPSRSTVTSVTPSMAAKAS